MSNTEYITIAEFAKKVGVSRQTLYNRLDKDLAEFVKEFDNGKRLSIKAFPLFDVKEQSNFDNALQSNFTGFDSDLTTILTTQLEKKDKQIEHLQEELTAIRKQLEEKDRLLEENNKHIREQEIKLSELLTQAQQLNYNGQVLLLKEKEKGKGFFKKLFSKRDKGDTEG